MWVKTMQIKEQSGSEHSRQSQTVEKNTKLLWYWLFIESAGTSVRLASK